MPVQRIFRTEVNKEDVGVSISEYEDHSFDIKFDNLNTIDSINKLETLRDTIDQVLYNYHSLNPDTECCECEEHIGPCYVD